MKTVKLIWNWYGGKFFIVNLTILIFIFFKLPEGLPNFKTKVRAKFCGAELGKSSKTWIARLKPKNWLK